MSERDVTPFGLPFPIKPKMLVLVIVGILIMYALLSSFYKVDQTEQAVILTLGKYTKTTGPGLHAKLPFNIQKHFIVLTKVQDLYFGYRVESSNVISRSSSMDFPGESIMLTGDLNIIDVEWSIQYKIAKPKDWLFNVDKSQVQRTDNRIKTIRDISQSVMNMLIGDSSINDVLGTERENIKIACRNKMNEILSNYKIGVDILEVKFNNVRPPEGEVFDSFEDVNIATQDMNRLINEGKEEYNKVIPRAQGMADKMIQEAQGYAAERVNQAKGDVARFTSVKREYQRNRQVTRDRLYIETMEEILSKEEETDVIDKNLDNFLPLKNMGSKKIEGVQR